MTRVDFETSFKFHGFVNVYFSKNSYLLYIVHIRKTYFAIRKIHFGRHMRYKKCVSYVSYILSDTVSFMRDIFAKDLLL